MDQVGMGTKAQFAHHVGAVGLGRARADAQPGGDFGVGVPYLHVSNKKRFLTGDDLLSQGVSPQVPSALEGLTSWFGMEQGVSPPLESPEEPHLAYGLRAAYYRLSAIQHPKN